MSNLQTSSTPELSAFSAEVMKMFAAIEADVVTNNAMFNLAVGNSADIQRQLKVLASETLELSNAISTNNAKEFFDGIGDCLYVVASLKQLEPELWQEFYYVREALHMVLLALHGLEDQDWPLAIMSATKEAMIGNLTKFDVTLADAEATALAYNAKGVETKITKLKEDMFIESASADDKSNDVVAGKVLKSTARYTEPNFAKVASYFTVEWESII